MFIIERVAELYRNELITMLQLNLLVLILSIVLYDYWKARKNPLARQVLTRMKKSKREDTKNFFVTYFEKTVQKLSKVEKKAEIKLARANLDFTPKEYVSFFLIGIIVGGVVGFVVFPFAELFKSLIFFLDDSYLKTFAARILSTVAFASAGTLTPYFWTQHLIKKRKKKLEDLLLEFLLSLADGVKSSPTVQEALKVVANECPEPLSSELSKTIQELQYAKPFEEAMQSLSDRIGVKEYALAINAIQIQDRTGGELEKLLRNMATVFQQRQELMAEVRKIVRGSKTTSYILLAAPFVFLLLFSTMSTGFFASLFSSTIGWICVIAGVVFYVVAFILIMQINKYVDKVV